MRWVSVVVEAQFSFSSSNAFSVNPSRQKKLFDEIANAVHKEESPPAAALRSQLIKGSKVLDTYDKLKALGMFIPIYI